MTRAALAGGIVAAAAALLVSTRTSAKEHSVITISALQHPHDLSERVASIEIFSIPQSIMTRSTIMPATIETFSRVEKRTLTSSADRAAFFAALEASKPAMGKQVAEFRIKAVLLDAAQSRVAEIYASPIASAGMLGESTTLTFGTKAFVDYVLEAVQTSRAR